MKLPKKMPSHLPHGFDILPPLGIQRAVDEGLELYHLKATVSIQEGKENPREVKTEYGVLRAFPAMMNKVVYEVGVPFPTDGENAIPQKELIRDVTNKMGNVVMLPDGRTEYPDIVLKQRGVTEKIPKDVEELEKFQADEHVFYFQKAYGSLYRTIARKFHVVGLMNPYLVAKNELLYHGIIKTLGSPVLQKIRSILVTDSITTPTTGWSRMTADDILTLEQALIAKKWWRDIAVPEPVEIDGLRGHIYRALRRERRIAI